MQPTILRPNIATNSRSSVKTELESYTGKSLDWFELIDLFRRSRIYDTGKSPGGKLDIFKRHLEGDFADLVHGLGGEETGILKHWTDLSSTVVLEM
jgi:hypothetical protein